jgi:hypothetical protein
MYKKIIKMPSSTIFNLIEHITIMLLVATVVLSMIDN